MVEKIGKDLPGEPRAWIKTPAGGAPSPGLLLLPGFSEVS